MPKITRIYSSQHRRRKEGRTDYRARLAMVKSGKVRIVVRKSLSRTIVQFIEFGKSGDRTVASATSSKLKEYGWIGGTGNLPSAYLTGLLAGTLAKKKGVRSGIFDIGLQRSTKGSRLYTALKGILDAGIEVAYAPEILPAMERIEGRHIEGLKSEFNSVKQNIISKTADQS